MYCRPQMAANGSGIAVVRREADKSKTYIKMKYKQMYETIDKMRDVLGESQYQKKNHRRWYNENKEKKHIRRLKHLVQKLDLLLDAETQTTVKSKPA